MKSYIVVFQLYYCGHKMERKKNRFSHLKRQKIDKEVVDQIKDTKRRMKEKIVEGKSKE